MMPGAISETITLPGFDGAPLAVRLMGEGRPLLLLHGLFSNAETNWVRHGTAGRLVAAGFRLILPDFRGHGASAAPADPAAWPEDVLARDIEAVAAALGLGPDLLLGGYSLGARTAVRLLVRGDVRAQGAILSGMGLEGVTGGAERGRWFASVVRGRGTFPRGTPEFFASAFLAANVARPEVLLPLLDSMTGTPIEALAALRLPVGVVCGVDDRDNGSAAALVDALPEARLFEVPGNHMSAVTMPAFGMGILEALAWIEERAAC
jgi:pimeloyl-ACP methyl ester carboxylesterase